MFNNFVIKLSCSIIAQKTKLCWCMYYWVRGSAVLMHGYGGPGDPMLIYVCCARHVFLCLNTKKNLSTNTIYICLILSTIYVFIPVSGCVGRGPRAFPCPHAYNAVYTALVWGCFFIHSVNIFTFFVWIVGFFLYQFRRYMCRSYSLIR